VGGTILWRDIVKVLNSIDRDFINKCTMLRDARLYTISSENIACIAYAMTVRTFEFFFNKMRNIEREVEIPVRIERVEKMEGSEISSLQEILVTLLMFLIVIITILLLAR